MLWRKLKQIKKAREYWGAWKKGAIYVGGQEGLTDSLKKLKEQVF